mmetsp:Transcript_16313/g.28537  ORF Transcript_16313/g.28537 Transcript_16313/m.28537 type:complete len:400 (+) Transcript_16313:358-1557(+)
MLLRWEYWRAIIIQTLVVSISLILFAVSLGWTLNSWAKYNEQDYKGWVEVQCTVDRTNVAESPTQFNAWRSEIIVVADFKATDATSRRAHITEFAKLTNHGSRNIQANIRPDVLPGPPIATAYRTGTDEYLWSFSDAVNFNNRYILGKRYICWYWGSNADRVKMTSDYAGFNAYSKSSVYDPAVLSTSICVLMGLIYLGIVAYVWRWILRTRERFVADDDEEWDELDDEELQIRLEKLSELRLITEWELDALEREQVECPICLEVFKRRETPVSDVHDDTSRSHSSPRLGRPDEISLGISPCWSTSRSRSPSRRESNESAGEVYKLDCSHTFHAHCLRSWCSRGGESCPMCKMPLWEPKATEGADARQSARHRTVDDHEPLDLEFLYSSDDEVRGHGVV